MGSTGDPPVPVGDSPTGIEEAMEPRPASFRFGNIILVPPGESQGRTGGSPVLPETEFPDTLYESMERA